MTLQSLPPDKEGYLQHFRRALNVLPPTDQDDIVAEVEAHIEERVESGITLNAVLAALGPPQDYAHSFIEGDKRRSVTESRQFAATSGESGTHIKAILTAIIFGVLWIVALLVGFVAVMKIFYPANIGLWRSETQYFLGFNDRPDAADELLGFGLFSLALGLLALSGFISRRFVARFTKANSNRGSPVLATPEEERS